VGTAPSNSAGDERPTRSISWIKDLDERFKRVLSAEKNLSLSEESVEKYLRENYGGKALGLLYLQSRASKLGFKIPEFDFITTKTFDEFMSKNGISRHEIHGIYSSVDPLGVTDAYLGPIRQMFLHGSFSEKHGQIMKAMLNRLRAKGVPLVLSSSSMMEDSEQHLFKGVYDSAIVATTKDAGKDFKAFETAVKKIYASVFSPKAYGHREENKIPDEDRMGVIVKHVIGRLNKSGDAFYPPISGVTVFTPYNPKATFHYVNAGLNTKTVRGEYSHCCVYQETEGGKKHQSTTKPPLDVFQRQTNFDYIDPASGSVISDTSDEGYDIYDRDYSDFLKKFGGISCRDLSFTGQFTSKVDSVSTAIQKELGVGVELEWSVDANGELFIYQRRPSLNITKILIQEVNVKAVAQEYRIADGTVVSGHKEVLGPLVISPSLMLKDLMRVEVTGFKAAKKHECEGYILMGNWYSFECFEMSAYALDGILRHMVGFLNTSTEPVPLAAHWSGFFINNNIPILTTTHINEKLLKRIASPEEYRDILVTDKPVVMAVNAVQQKGHVYLQ